jgi:hypothetical protein
MSFYSWLITLSELLMFAMTLHVIHYSGFTKEQKTWFSLTFISVMVCAFAEYVVHSGHVPIKSEVVLTAITIMQFTLAPMLGVLFVGALGLHRQVSMAVLLFLVSLLVEVIAVSSNAIFYFDAEGYHRGRMFILYEGLYVFSLLYLIGGMVVVGRRFKHRDSMTLIMIPVILAAGLIPMTVYQLNVTYFAVSISGCLCYIYYNDLVQEDIKSDLLQSQDRLVRMQTDIISGLANIIESRDMETGEHINRTSALARAIAECAREDGVYADELDDHFISLLYTLAPMHDVGKILVPDNILKKPGKLTASEFEQIKRHASEGGHIVKDVLSDIANAEYVKFASDIAVCHHERWDGTGYPNRLKGEEIPLSARIMAIADVYDALVSERCYKKAMSKEEAIKVIQDEAGTHFDPKLAEVFLKHHLAD